VFKTDVFVHILYNDDKLQHIEGQLSDIDKNTITTDKRRREDTFFAAQSESRISAPFFASKTV
jgi:hypothetical protein